MTIIVYIFEVIKDTFTVFRSPSAVERQKISDKKIKGQQTQANENAQLNPKNLKLDGIVKLVEISISRSDKMQQSREHSFQKSFQLMALNLAVLVFVGQLYPENAEKLCYISHWICRASLLLMLFSGVKSAFHCLAVIRPQETNELKPISSKDAYDDEKSFWADILDDVVDCDEKNDIVRAVIAEHSYLATSSTYAQVFFSSVVLTNILLSDIPCFFYLFQ